MHQTARLLCSGPHTCFPWRPWFIAVGHRVMSGPVGQWGSAQSRYNHFHGLNPEVLSVGLLVSTERAAWTGSSYIPTLRFVITVKYPGLDLLIYLILASMFSDVRKLHLYPLVSVCKTISFFYLFDIGMCIWSVFLLFIYSVL